MCPLENCHMRSTSGLSLSAALARLGVAAPGLVWCMGGLQFVLGLVALGRWIATGDMGHLDYYCRQEGSAILAGFAAIEYLLSLAAWRLFDRREPLGTAWLFIMVGAGFRVAGLVIANFFSGFFRGDVNPVAIGNTSLRAAAVRDLGLAFSSPFCMAMLAIGLLVVLRLYRDVGLLRRLRWPDFVLLAVAAAFLLSQTYELGRWLAALEGPVTLAKSLSWLINPLLGLLLLEAILIRRSVVNMGGGLVGRCWGAYAAGIFLTLLGDAGIWAITYGHVTWQLTYAMSYVWFLASIAFALGPAYQVEAIIRARRYE
jgi:hypothetical protein